MTAVIECAGVGYGVRVPLSTLEKIEAGDEVRLYTYLHVREDDLKLFGFYTSDERRFFEQILSVTGVGPAIALAALSALSVAELRQALATGDVRVLTRIKGVGKRLAERLVLELKDRLPAATSSEASSSVGAASASNQEEDAIAALVALGFSPKDAGSRVGSALEALTGRGGAGFSVEQLIRESLR